MVTLRGGTPLFRHSRSNRKPPNRLLTGLAGGFWGQAAESRLRFLVVLPAVMVAVMSLLIALTPLPEPQVPLASRFLNQNGQTFATMFVENRRVIPFSEMPVSLRSAIVAIEDDRFYAHRGFNFRSLARAFAKNLIAGRIVEGGSTITQQLAKNLYLTQKRTITRKIREAILTIKLELRFSKQEILKMYLNTIYFGTGTYGVEVASQTYFGKRARDLTLSESALLAGLPRGPEIFSPFKNPDRARDRRDTVLNRMAELGFITSAQVAEAKSAPLGVIAPTSSGAGVAPYFVDLVVKEIGEEHPDIARDLARGGYEIVTTIDVNMQRAAERAFAQGIPPGSPDSKGIPQPQGALVAIDPGNGFIKAVVGGRESATNRFNRAVQAKRQPGSAFKPFLYTALLSEPYEFTAASMQVCEPVSFPGGAPGETYKPRDYGEPNYHYRPLSVREAIKVSDNVVAVRWMAAIGPKRVIDFAKKMGIGSPLAPNLSLALGTSEVSPLELTAAYAPLANGGYRVEPIAVLKITDRFGSVIAQRAPRREKVIDEKVAFIVTDMMKEVVRPGGTGARVLGVFDRPAAGKTGTTNEYRDAWFIGFTPDLVTTVWIGNDDPRKPVGAPGGRVSAPIWASFMAEALANAPVRDFAQPPGVIAVDICPETGLLPNFTSIPRREWFIRGTEPTTTCPQFQLPNLQAPPGAKQYPTPPGGPGATPDLLPGSQFRLFLNRLFGLTPDQGIRPGQAPRNVPGVR